MSDSLSDFFPVEKYPTITSTPCSPLRANAQSSNRSTGTYTPEFMVCSHTCTQHLECCTRTLQSASPHQQEYMYMQTEGCRTKIYNMAQKSSLYDNTGTNNIMYREVGQDIQFGNLGR